jgi:hypothetical protein
MSMIAALSVLMAAQTAEAVIAVRADDPETWVLEYPFAVEPYVNDYYNCLKSRNHVIGNGMGFADQHQGDVPKCAEVRGEALELAREVLERRGPIEGFDADRMNAVFDTIEFVHIERGRDLDRQIALRLGQPPTHYADRSDSSAEAANPAGPAAAQKPAQNKDASSAVN